MRCSTLQNQSASSSIRAFIVRFDSIYSVDPALARIPAEVRQAAIALLDQVTNGVERLLALEPTPRGWRARFLENGKPVLAEWDGRELVTTLLSDIPVKGSQRTDAIRKNCVKGRWCVGKTGRGTCIAANRKCRQQLLEQAIRAAERLTEALREAAQEPQIFSTESDLLQRPVDPWASKGNPPDAPGGRTFNRDDFEWESPERQMLSYLLADQAGISSARYVVVLDHDYGKSKTRKRQDAEEYLQQRLQQGDFLDGDIIAFPVGWNSDNPIDGPSHRIRFERILRYNAQTNQLEPVEIPPERVRLAQRALRAGNEAFASTTWVDQILHLHRSGDPSYTKEKAQREIDREEKLMARYAKLDNQLRGRQPQGKVRREDEYIRRANNWAREMGLRESANGFSAEATRAHDVAHPILHEMLGMGSRQIQQFFGTSDLIAEEAAVNTLEWMSRGAPPSAALANGLRLARHMSRGTPQASVYRTPQFRSKLAQVVQKLYDNPDFHEYLSIVRKYNRISQTVSRAAGV